MNVLIDYAHADLWESLALLFEDRLGWKLYRPIGIDWFNEGIWRFERDTQGDAVAWQFLRELSTDQTRDGWSERAGSTHPRPFRLVTLGEARELRPELVIATLAENEEGLHRFAREVGAHYGIQIGNQDALNRWHLAEFGLSSVKLAFTPWVPSVTYHQEFSLADFRVEPEPANPDLVMTRVQCFAGQPEYQRFRSLAGATPELRWRHFGHCGLDDDLFGGDAATTSEVAEQIRNAGAIYHYKAWSDGYGHVVHNAFAVGRPILVNMGYYKDKLAGELMIDGETCLDLDRLSDHEVVEAVRQWRADPDAAARMGTTARRRFDQVVDFGAEAEAIRTLLEGVLSDKLVTA